MAENLFTTPNSSTEKSSEKPSENSTSNVATPAKTDATTEAPKAPEQNSEAAQTTQTSQTTDTSEPAKSETNEAPSELDMLKKRASIMGITYSNNIGIDALKAKIQEKLDTEKANELKAKSANSEDNTDTDNTSTKDVAPKKERTPTLREYMIREKMKLLRCRITNLDPKKKDLQGEIITVSNEYLGTVRKYVPFGEYTDNGYHIPQCIYDVLNERTFVSIKVRKDARGQEIVEHQNAREFAIEILPQLTPDEIAKLGAAQAASGSTN